MRVFIYEFMTGGGLFAVNGSPRDSSSLLREGLAMARAVMADFQQIPGWEVCALRDARIAPGELPISTLEVVSAVDEQRKICQMAEGCDATLVIAPETDGLLATRSEWCEQVGARLLSPDSRFCRLAADKMETGKCWLAAKVPVPRAIRWSPATDLPLDWLYPAVLKPIDGAGSTDTHLLSNSEFIDPEWKKRPWWRLEEYQTGVAVSVAVICGREQNLVLPPCSQWLSDDGRFRYLGGRLPLAPASAERATKLAQQALRALPPTLGYLGLDLVLASDQDGRDDRVIEVNPRLTTSYVGLRQLVTTNLAQAMVDQVRGLSHPLSVRKIQLEFASDGTVRPIAAR